LKWSAATSEDVGTFLLNDDLGSSKNSTCRTGASYVEVEEHLMLVGKAATIAPTKAYPAATPGGLRSDVAAIYVLNNLGNQWSGTSVKTKTKWAKQRFKPVAWDGHDTAHPDERTTDADGNAEFPPPPRGYCVYAPVFE
jgi:hypothetical protein